MKPPSRRLIARILLLSTILALVGCDHATKHLARTHLEHQTAVTLITGLLDLRYTENPGVAFSMFRDLPVKVRQPLLIGLGALALGVVLLYWWRLRRTGRLASDRWTTLALALIVAGALGNQLDRIARGYVIDFVHLHHYSIFNLADVFIAFGGALLLLRLWRGPKSAAAEHIHSP